jgi:beta-xylosidase
MNVTCPPPLVILPLIGIALTGALSAQAPARPAVNPVLWADVPDPAVIRVDSIYYMTSTTMHMSPGVPIMKSTNLVDWRMVGYVYDALPNVDAMAMRAGQSAYGRGTWASSLRYHDGTFRVVTFSYTTGETYVFTTDDIERGPWQRASLSGLYHDPSLFFDDDGRVWLVHGVGDIRIVELNADGGSVKAGGENRVLIRNAGGIAGTTFNVRGEGSHMVKVNGRYYLFLITWPRGGMRTELVYRADRLDGPWEGRIALADEGIAQGGIVDTPEGDWYALLFGDRGAVGRIPHLVPVTWADGWPVFGIDGRVPDTLDVVTDGTGVSGIVASDEFDDTGLGLAWQWNHNPANTLWSLDTRPGHLRLTTGRIDRTLVGARNTLTQRTFGPTSAAATALDVTGMKDGDVAGLTLLSEEWGFVGVKKEGESTFVVMESAASGEVERIRFDDEVIGLRAEADFRDQADRAVFSYSLDGLAWRRLGETLQMRYTLGHFMGYRFGLFSYATTTPGGWVDFDYLRVAPMVREDGPSEDRRMPDGSARYIVDSPGADRYELAANGEVAALHLDTGEWPGVIRAANDLKADFGRVTGVEANVFVGSQPATRRIVLIGTLGRSATIDRLVAQGKIDGSALAGKWETFITQVVRDPMPGVDRALVIAGSDKRGTIYGIYDISAQIGVSPWYWWADVAVPRQSSLYVLAGVHTQGTPAVKYRGIFINDEAPAMSGWTREHNGGFNSTLYTKVFELILRLKGNYLWPAMWGSAFNMDDPQNPVLADEYGIVMSTSHHEPMQRAQQEWRRVGSGEWNYEHNDSVLREFWRDGIRNMGDSEGVVTLAMRGDGDMPMSEDANIALLERIVADQRRIIAEVTGRDPSETPQVWALYKEVQEYYDRGMRVPDDVTLLFADDNWGNIRRLPPPADRDRDGGFGVYYHFDYVGGPRNYKWLNTNPVPRIWEQMHLAHEYGANRVWVVNVGDIKPMEYPIQFFLDYAWNPSRTPASRLPEYARLWATQQFGSARAADIAEVVTTYLKYAGRRKPELLDTVTFSLMNFREAETAVADWRALESRADELARALPGTHSDAYYQLVLHPIQAMANLADLHVTAGRNRLYAWQGRAATNALADRVRELFQRDAQISAFYNDTLAGGKWRHMMDQTHIGYTYWQEPPRNVMPRVDIIQVPEPAEMGVGVVEVNRAPPSGRGGRGGPPPRGPFGPAMIPELDRYGEPTRHLDVYNRGASPFRFTAETDEPWVSVSPSAGTVDTALRVAVEIDWTRAPTGADTAAVTFTGPDSARIVVRVPIVNPSAPGTGFAGFVQGANYVSMEAGHFTRAVDGSGIAWEIIPDFGRTLSGVHTTPVTAASTTPGGSTPHLEYRVFLRDTGTVRVNAYISPTWDFRGGDGLRYAVSIDDEAPQIVNIHADGSSTGITDGNRAWEQGVASAIKVLTSEHTIATQGEHIVKFWRVDPGIVLQKLVVSFGDVPESWLGPPESFRSSAGDAGGEGRTGLVSRKLPAAHHAIAPVGGFLDR